MSNKKPEDYLVDKKFAEEKIPSELKNRGFNSEKNAKEIYTIINWDFKRDYHSIKNKVNMFCNNGNHLWRVKLSKKPTDSFYNSFILDKCWHTNYLYMRSNDVHRGHYIARRFKNYLIPNEFSDYQKVNKFFGKGNIINVYPQSANSNCNSNEMNGQLFYEKRVIDFLEKSELNEVFYEIENFILENKKSLGRRIKGIFVSEGELVNKDNPHFHVFIPNIFYKNSNIPEPKDY